MRLVQPDSAKEFARVDDRCSGAARGCLVFGLIIYRELTQGLLDGETWSVSSSLSLSLSLYLEHT